MNVTCQDDTGCPVLLNSECVFYEGASLPDTGINTNDDLQIVIQKLNTAIASGGGDFWNLATGATLIGVNNIISNVAEQLLFDGTWIATSNLQSHVIFGGNFTGRALQPSDNLYGYTFSPTMTAGSSGTYRAAVNIEPTFVGSGSNFALRSIGSNVFVGAQHLFFNAAGSEGVVIQGNNYNFSGASVSISAIGFGYTVVSDDTTISGSSNILELDSSGIIITLSSTNTFREALDYSGNYVARSYITKGYADITYWPLNGTGIFTGNVEIQAGNNNWDFISGSGNINLSSTLGDIQLVTISGGLNLDGGSFGLVGNTSGNLSVTSGTLQLDAANAINIIASNTLQLSSSAQDIVMTSENLDVSANNTITFTSISLIISINGDSGSTGEALVSDGAGGVIWGSVGGGWSTSGATAITANTSQAGAFTNDFQLNEVIITQNVQTSGSPRALYITGGQHTTLAASTEASTVYIDPTGGGVVQFATGALGTQRSVVILGGTYAFVASSTITDAATLGIAGAAGTGTNASITNSHGILVSTIGVGSNVTNSYGITVNAMTGATNNYAAQLLGGRGVIFGNIAVNPSTVANAIVIHSRDSSDGATNSTLALQTEQSPEATATFTQTHRIKIWWNGTEYWLPLDAV
jgi:hypothetical protein